MLYDLSYGETETLLGQVLDDEPFLPDLLVAIREIEKWEHFLDIRLYDLYRAKFAVLVSADSSPESIERFSEHLSAARGVLTRKKKSELPEKLAIINDLLKDQLIRLEELRPGEIAKRRHVEPMLRCLWESNGPMERSILRDELALAEPNLTRVLNLAQTAALITRTRAAKSVQVALTPLGTAICEKLFTRKGVAIVPKKEVARPAMVITENTRSYVCKFELSGKFILIHVAPRHRTHPSSSWSWAGQHDRNPRFAGGGEITMKLPNQDMVRTIEACVGRSDAVPVSIRTAG